MKQIHEILSTRTVLEMVKIWVLNYFCIIKRHMSLCCGAAEWGKGVNRLLLAYEDAKVLGFSATSVRYLDSQRDMAQELFDGHTASEMTLGEAIVKKILLSAFFLFMLIGKNRKD